MDANVVDSDSNYGNWRTDHAHSDSGNSAGHHWCAVANLFAFATLGNRICGLTAEQRAFRQLRIQCVDQWQMDGDARWRVCNF
jgi:hypothetical protein